MTKKFLLKGELMILNMLFQEGMLLGVKQVQILLSVNNKEELGVDISVDRLIWVEEVFWKWGVREAHTLCHYHLVSLNIPTQIPSNGFFKSLETDESKLIFQWVDINELQDYKVYPVFVKDKITNLSDGIEYFVTRD